MRRPPNVGKRLAHPKSASAISPGPLTMQPMTAMDTPGRCPVRWRICSVTSCRSNSVRPHDGHDTYSVLVLRMRDPCEQLPARPFSANAFASKPFQPVSEFPYMLREAHAIQQFTRSPLPLSACQARPLLL